MQYVYINVIFPELAQFFLCKLSAFLLLLQHERIVICMRILAAMMIVNVGANSISFLRKKKSTINHHRFHLECIILRKSQISPTAPSHRYLLDPEIQQTNRSLYRIEKILILVWFFQNQNRNPNLMPMFRRGNQTIPTHNCT